MTNLGFYAVLPDLEEKEIQKLSAFVANSIRPLTKTYEGHVCTAAVEKSLEVEVIGRLKHFFFSENIPLGYGERKLLLTLTYEGSEYASRSVEVK